MDSIGRAIDAMMKSVLILGIIFIPLGLWKLIEVIIWVFTHVKVGYE